MIKPLITRLAMVLLGLTLTLGAGGALSGCETMEGAGRDVEGAGEGIQDMAD